MEITYSAIGWQTSLPGKMLVKVPALKSGGLATWLEHDLIMAYMYIYVYICEQINIYIYIHILYAIYTSINKFDPRASRASRAEPSIYIGRRPCPRLNFFFEANKCLSPNRLYLQRK